MGDLQEGNAGSRGNALAAVLDRGRAMAVCRKLGKEIEQALKKANDGINSFQELRSKMEAAEVRPLFYYNPLWKPFRLKRQLCAVL